MSLLTTGEARGLLQHFSARKRGTFKSKAKTLYKVEETSEEEGKNSEGNEASSGAMQS